MQRILSTNEAVRNLARNGTKRYKSCCLMNVFQLRKGCRYLSTVKLTSFTFSTCLNGLGLVLVLPFPRFLSTLQICRWKIVFSFNVTYKYHLPQPANIVSSEWSVQSNSLSHFQFLGIQSPLLQANWFDGHLGVGVTNGFPGKSSYDINFLHIQIQQSATLQRVIRWKSS